METLNNLRIGSNKWFSIWKSKSSRIIKINNPNHSKSPHLIWIKINHTRSSTSKSLRTPHRPLPNTLIQKLIFLLKMNPHINHQSHLNQTTWAVSNWANDMILLLKYLSSQSLLQVVKVYQTIDRNLKRNQLKNNSDSLDFQRQSSQNESTKLINFMSTTSFISNINDIGSKSLLLLKRKYLQSLKDRSKESSLKNLIWGFCTENFKRSI